MQQYLNLVKTILNTGIKKDDRTGVGTLSIFGPQLCFDLSEGLPIITTRKINIEAIIYELLWFLKGDTNVHYLNDNNIHIWDQWADENGNLGPMYGEQWRYKPQETSYGISMPPIDQIDNIITQLCCLPNSRRHIIVNWDLYTLPDERFSPQENVQHGKAALSPCHGNIIQFYIANNKLSCSVYSRSQDVLIGTVFNIVLYALLTHIVSQQCNLKVGNLIYTMGDTHIYLNHLEQAQLLLTRKPYELPILAVNKAKSINDYDITDFKLFNYQYHPVIKIPVNV